MTKAANLHSSIIIHHLINYLNYACNWIFIDQNRNDQLNSLLKPFFLSKIVLNRNLLLNTAKMWNALHMFTQRARPRSQITTYFLKFQTKYVRPSMYCWQIIKWLHNMHKYKYFLEAEDMLFPIMSIIIFSRQYS